MTTLSLCNRDSKAQIFPPLSCLGRVTPGSQSWGGGEGGGEPTQHVAKLNSHPTPPAPKRVAVSPRPNGHEVAPGPRAAATRPGF